jgi:hypothetical protein
VDILSPIAAIDATGVGTLLLGLAGVIGAIAALAKFGREDESTAVKTQSTVLVDMKSLNDELIEALERCRTERLRVEQELRTISAREAILVARVRALGGDPS